MFCGKCGMLPCSRGERARRLELLFAALYRRIISVYEAEGFTRLYVEPIASNIASHVWGARYD